MERNSGHDDKECLTDKGARHDMNDEFGQEVEITDEEVAEADRINDFSEDLFLLATASRSERMKADVEQRLADFHRTHKAGNRRMSRHRVIGLVAVAAATVACIVWWCNTFFFSGEQQEWVAFMPDSIPAQVRLESDERSEAGILNWKSLVAAVPNRTNELDYCRMTDLMIPLSNKDVHHTLSVPYGETFKITLSDGTEVILNAGSRLTYPVRFTKAERRVRLEGEAYFKVAKDAAHPFVVEAGVLTARVLGTTVNLAAYKGMSPALTLFEGCVEADGGVASSAVRMEPGMSVNWNAEKLGFDVSRVDLDTEALWREGYFYYDNVPLLDIMKDLGRWYNVSVVFCNAEALDCRLHYVADRREDLQHAVTLLNRMQKFKVTLKDDHRLYVE